MRKAELAGLRRAVWEMDEILVGRMKPARVTTSEQLLGTEIPDVAELRARHKMTQAEFATSMEVSVAKVRDWEQKRRVPEGHERIRLQVLDQFPDIALHPEKYVEPPRRRKATVTKRSASRRAKI